LCFDLLRVAIRASSHKEIETLVHELASEDGVRREAAIARLTIIGRRAAARLGALADDASLGAGIRVAALRALQGIADPATLDAALRIAEETGEDTIAAAAVEVARGFLQSSRGVEVTDRLAGLALDAARPIVVRLAAIRALRDLDRSTIAPLMKKIRADAAPEIAAAAAARESDVAAATDPRECLVRAADGVLPEDPGVLRRALAAAGGDVPVTTIQRVVDRVREREGAEPVERRIAWQTARAAAHLALARRGSRVALYDLRESLESARAPLPVEFLAAIMQVGDSSCLEPLATAWRHAGGAEDRAWWRAHVADAFRAIAAREKVTRRHAAAKRIQKKWPEVMDALWPPR
jgi:hypothetical protein